MRHTLTPLVAAVLLAGPSAHAGDAPRPKVLGWSTVGDTHLLAYLPTPEWFGDQGEEGFGPVETATIVDARSGAVQEYVLNIEATLQGDDKKKFDALPKKAEFEAWKKAHAPRCASGRSSPDGTLRAEVEVSGKRIHGAWKKDVFVFDTREDEDNPIQEYTGVFSMGVSQGGKTIESAVWAGSSGGNGGSLHGDIRACWSPDGKRIAWVVHRGSAMMRDTGESAVIAGATTAPRVQLVADKSVLTDAVAKVGAAIERAGFVATGAKASNEKTPRPATVIYAAKGFEQAAADLAKAIPGGATVGKLDWKAPFDLVVGIGATALR